MAPQRIPAPSPNFHKGKFYNCMMNIEENRVMVVGGRPGQFFDVWDDKTFVYEWQKGAKDIAKNGKWIGTDGSRLDDSTDGCKVRKIRMSHLWVFWIILRLDFFTGFRKSRNIPYLELRPFRIFHPIFTQTS